MKQSIFTENENIKTIMLAMTIILGFVFIVSFSTIYVSDAIKNNNACGCVIPIPYMMLILSSLGLFIGCLSFYLLISKHLKEKKQITKSIEFTLNFLDNDEKAILKELIRQKKALTQSQLEKATGLHKVKVHRIIGKLRFKKLITKKSMGISNQIELYNELKELFY